MTQELKHPRNARYAWWRPKRYRRSHIIYRNNYAICGDYIREPADLQPHRPPYCKKCIAFLEKNPTAMPNNE